MNKKPITFVLFAYNEEKRIEYAIRCFRDFGPVIVFDGGSTDRTQEITERLGARFLPRPPSSVPQSETETNFKSIKENIDTPWIYWGYVDNIAPRTLVEELVRIASENIFKKVFVPMHTYLWGNTNHIAQKSLFPAIFHRDFMTFEDNHIHHMGTFTGTNEQVFTLPDKDEFALCHFSTYNETKFVSGQMRYAEEEARYKFSSGERFSVIKLFAAMLRYMWIYRRTFKTPKLGILIMLNTAFSRLMTYTRLYELENNITLETIEEKYSKEKERLLQTKE